MLSGQVAALRRDIDASGRTTGAENREVDEKHAVVHCQTDEIIADVGGMKTDVATIRDDV